MTGWITTAHLAPKLGRKMFACCEVLATLVLPGADARFLCSHRRVDAQNAALGFSVLKLKSKLLVLPLFSNDPANLLLSFSRRIACVDCRSFFRCKSCLAPLL